MLDRTRIPPVDIETLPDDLREVLEEQRKLRGRAAVSVPLLRAQPSLLPRCACDVDHPPTRDKARARYAPDAAQPSRRLVEQVRVLTGRQCCREQQARHLDGENRRAQRLREEPALQRRGEGSS